MEIRQKLLIKEIEALTANVYRYRFVSADECPLIPFHAGQYLSLYYEIGKTKTSRPYSIASAPYELEKYGYLDLIIYVEGEFTSKYFFENYHVGFSIMASAPRGNFTLNNKKVKSNIVCFSGGLSITPLLSIVKEYVVRQSDKTMFLISGWNQPREVIYSRELRALEAEYSNFYYQEYIQDYISLKTIEFDIDYSLSSFFIAGPRVMSQHLLNELKMQSVRSDDIFLEVPGEPKIENFTIEDEYPGLDFDMYELIVEGQSHWMNSHESILIALERLGYEIEAWDRSGTQESDLIRLESGELFIPSYWDCRTQTMRESKYYPPGIAFPLSENIRISFVGKNSNI